MEQHIKILANTWVDAYDLATVKEGTPLTLHNIGNYPVRVATDPTLPTRKDAGIKVGSSNLYGISVKDSAWIYCRDETIITVRWDTGHVYPPEVNIVSDQGPEIVILNSKIDELITIQRGMLLLLEAAFEDSLSSSNIRSGDLRNG